MIATYGSSVNRCRWSTCPRRYRLGPVAQGTAELLDQNVRLVRAICSAVRLIEAIASALATEQVGEKGDDGDHAQHVEQSRVPVERVHDHVDVSTEVVGAEAPDTCPDDRAGDIVYGEDPPRHPQDA